MKKIDLYYDHYKETFALSKEAQSRRNKNFAILCILEAVSFFMLIEPEEILSLVVSGINNKLETTLILSNDILQTLLWILIVYVLIRYCQDTLYIERQYRYLSKLERNISNEMQGSPFDREGDNYLNDYPMVLNFIDLFYKMLFPIMFFIINITRIYQEWSGGISSNFGLACDTVIFLTICIVIWFYFFEIHSKITKWCKDHIPFVNRIAKSLRKLLKEV